MKSKSLPMAKSLLCPVYFYHIRISTSLRNLRYKLIYINYSSKSLVLVSPCIWNLGSSLKLTHFILDVTFNGHIWIHGYSFHSSDYHPVLLYFLAQFLHLCLLVLASVSLTYLHHCDLFLSTSLYSDTTTWSKFCAYISCSVSKI